MAELVGEIYWPAALVSAAFCFVFLVATRDERLIGPMLLAWILGSWALSRIIEDIGKLQ